MGKRRETNPENFDPPVAQAEGDEEIVATGLLHATEGLQVFEAMLAAGVRAGDFWTPHWQRIVAAAVAVHDRGNVPHAQAIVAELRDRGETDGLGGEPNLARMGAEGPGLYPGIARMFGHIRDAAERRRLAAAAERFARDVHDESVPLVDIVEQLKGHAHETERRIATGGAPRQVQITSHAELAAKVLLPVKWAVPNLLPEGLAILAGKPKAGKSYLGFQIACAVGTGGQVFGKPVELGRVLYVALEDGVRRRQSRAQEQLWPATAQVDWADDLPTFGSGGFAELAALLQDGAYRLCVIDTIGRFLGAGDFNDYAQMTAAFGELQTLASQTATTLLCISHHHKAAAGDPVNDLLGSTGQSGVADTLMGLYRADRGSANWHLRIEGRDVDPLELELKRDARTRTWQLAADEHGVKAETIGEKILAQMRAGAGRTTAGAVAKALELDLSNAQRELDVLAGRGAVDRGNKEGRERPYYLPGLLRSLEDLSE